ncbi:hypothetical protein [Wolbachia endosymbiont of Cylisticus convexus]|uniref:hypothetical protein n=1 Tax=Wolbachia endosymbiont of Cylisticus convexus TaxID=118728 RepID=UPI0011C06DA3|nr:hypothetical protein [Wolbachia endosymbiont of Cylisticus convexus]
MSFFYLVNFLIFIAKVILESQRVTLIPGSQCRSTGMTTKGYLNDTHIPAFDAEIQKFLL